MPVIIACDFRLLDGSMYVQGKEHIRILVKHVDTYRFKAFNIIRQSTTYLSLPMSLATPASRQQGKYFFIFYPLLYVSATSPSRQQR